MRIAPAERCIELEPDMQHITLASHTSLALAHAALAPQVEFELLEGVQQQKHQWTRHQVVCIVFKEVVQINFNLRHKNYVANIGLVYN